LLLENQRRHHQQCEQRQRQIGNPLEILEAACRYHQEASTLAD
jgi:hypothetical protein